MISIGEKIAELRKSRKMTQEELANIVGVSAQSVSKWENSQTMPDIMLLPTLAAALDVTVNDLFSIVSAEDRFESIHPDKVPERAYQELFRALQQGLCDGDSVSKEEISRYLNSLRGRRQQSGLVSYGEGGINGAAYVNASVALSFIKPNADALSLLDDDQIAEPLTVLADGNARRVLKYLLTNGRANVTAAVAANKCGIPVQEAETVLDRLSRLGIVRVLAVETGEDRPLYVYYLYAEYKMFMTVFPILELAKVLAESPAGWVGFRA